MKEEKEGLLKKLSAKYRLNIINPENFEEIYALNFSWLQVLMLTSMIVMLSFISSFLLIVYTPAKEYFIGANEMEVSQVALNSLMLKIDSLEYNLKINEQYLANVQRVLKGEAAPEFEEEMGDDAPLKPVDNKELYAISSEDSALRAELGQETFELNRNTETKDVSLHFYAPINGVVVKQYSQADNHLALDIVADKNAPVKSIEDGNVIFAEYSASTGNVIMIQHRNNFISVYKHNSVIMKQVGSFVKAGETIGIIGNSGELTTGSHLHFELWYNGQSVDPENYIVF